MAQTLWKRKFVHLDEYLGEMVTQWQYVEERVVYNVEVRDFYSDWGGVKQISIFKPPKEDDNTFDKEPNMSEKKFVLEGVCQYSTPDEIAFEIFPAQNNIVDRFDIYHLWSLKKRDIPFYYDVKIPKIILRWKKATINNKIMMYTTQIRHTPKGKQIRVYFIQAADGSELKWYDKQNFKDEVIGKDIIAIEFVTDNLPKISALVCVPKSIKKLPFGLR